METESNILRSPTLIRQTITQLRDEGLYDVPPACCSAWCSGRSAA